jgi:tetratricopeptide (TPR) repeat protein
MSSPLIEEGLAALRDGDTATARRVLELAVTEVESGEALEGLAEALYLEHEYIASAARYERAYIAYRHGRDHMAAGRAARAVAWITGNVLGDWAVQSGWLARAQSTLKEAQEDRPEQGWVLIIKAWLEPDAKTREMLLREAIAVGRRFGDPDIEFEALSYLGGVFIMTDRVEQGLLFFDEALAAVCAGELKELATMDAILCGFFWACELVNDVPLADQWMRAAADLMKQRNVVAAFCRAHYGGILTAAGRWNEAETELLEAAHHFDRGLSSLGQLLGQDTSLAVAGATLAMAALFQPLRHRIQAGVDRRFNRRRHDTAMTIEAFTAHLRDQIDLDTLSAELVAAVEQTMEPTRLSLWLRQSSAKRWAR